VQAVTQTGIVVCRLDYGNITIAIATTWGGTMKYSEGDYLASVQFYNFVTILGLTAISVMHIRFLSLAYSALKPCSV
jgi:hypothetical protein